MIFDERKLHKSHVEKAIHYFIVEKPKYYPARSAFLIKNGKKIPAKFIVRLAFKELTGTMPESEQVTGGRASVRVLQKLDFNAIYEKPPKRANRNPIKSARREAFKQILKKQYGAVEEEFKFDEIKVPDLINRESIDSDLLRILNAIEGHRNITISGRKNYKLRCDYYLPAGKLIVEFDERQHFTPLRATSLQSYPPDTSLGFKKARWIQLSNRIQAGDNSPIYRDEQRAFYDSIRDIIAPKIGLKPVVRIFEEDVLWEKEQTQNIQNILYKIDKILKF